MSKELGQKIVIQFSEKLTGDVTGLIPQPLASGDYFTPSGTASASSQYSSYEPSRAFDGSTSNYWYTRTSGDQYIQISLIEPTWAYGFRWYAWVNKPKAFQFQGSNDGETWELLLSSISPDVYGWNEFQLDTPKQYQYYRWTVTSRYSTYLYIYEIELLGGSGNEIAFTISGKELEYIDGPTIDKAYKVISVERHPDYTDDKHLMLTLHPQGRFNNVDGNLTVAYDASLGVLLGRGGGLENFEVSFLPTDLLPKPNPSLVENLSAKATTSIELVGVLHINAYKIENITLQAEASIDFIDIGIINP